MAICWILNWMLMVGFSSGLDAPACRLIVPFKLGSFCGLILPTSHDNNWKKTQFFSNVAFQDTGEDSEVVRYKVSLIEEI